MNGTKDMDDSCMEIRGDVEWVREYGDIVWSSKEVSMTPADGVHTNEGVDLSDRVEISYNGMTQWDCQMVPDGLDPDIDSKVVAMSPSSDLTSTWKGDPIQQEPADETNVQILWKDVSERRFSHPGCQDWRADVPVVYQSVMA